MSSRGIPSQNLDDFMRNFSYNGYTRTDIDRRGAYTNDISDDFYETPDRLKGLRIKGAEINAQWRENYGSGNKFSYVNKIEERDDIDIVRGKNPYSYNLVRKNDLNRPQTELANLDDYAFHRQDNKFYGEQRFVAEVEEDEGYYNKFMLHLIDDLSDDIEGDSRLNVYKRVDEAIEMAERLEDSNVNVETRQEGIRDLIKLFNFMDLVIADDISRFGSDRNADKGNRGENTGLQTSKEKDAVQQMAFRTKEKSKLNKKLDDLKSDQITLRVFNRL